MISPTTCVVNENSYTPLFTGMFSCVTTYVPLLNVKLTTPVMLFPNPSTRVPFINTGIPMYPWSGFAYTVKLAVWFLVVMLVNSFPSLVRPVLFSYVALPLYTTVTLILSFTLSIGMFTTSPLNGMLFVVVPSTVMLNVPVVIGFPSLSVTRTSIETFPLVLLWMLTIVFVGILIIL